MTDLLIFGAGYAATFIAASCGDRYSRIWGTTRSRGNFARLRAHGIEPLQFGGKAGDQLREAAASARNLLVSIAPDDDGDPVLRDCAGILSDSTALQWACYLSTVGVYGDHGGGWVDENAICRPVSRRSVARLAAENRWRAFAQRKALPLAIFRLSGIYGPGRNVFVNIERERTRRIVKPDQVFNRIHRDDIARAFLLAAEQLADGVFNITDDRPAPPQDLVTLAHHLEGSEPPPLIDFDKAELTPMARSFYGENKRVSNAKSKEVLGMEYEWPEYETALRRMWNDGSWRPE